MGPLPPMEEYLPNSMSVRGRRSHQRNKIACRKVLHGTCYSATCYPSTANASLILLMKGYAKKALAASTAVQGKLWYLPHHPVFHPAKPNNVCVVFDCWPKYHGSSLNDQLLQGLDLANSLSGVLMQFHQGPVAFMSDVEAMLLHIHVSLEDCNALQFLWWPDSDIEEDNRDEFQTNLVRVGSRFRHLNHFGVQTCQSDSSTGHVL